jgi:outer membrane receptor protein involved in Fe transport
VVRGEELLKNELARQTLSTEELSKIPGALGDPLRAIENLPGAARPPLNLGLFIIEGGRPTDSRVYLAGNEVPQLYHYGGFTSVVPASFIRSIDYLPHNFSARYGRAIAGTIDLDLRPGKRDGFHGALDINPVHAGLEVEGPLRRGSFLLGLRRSYIDGSLALLMRIAGEPEGLRLVRAPVYWDYQAALDYPLYGGHLRLLVAGADDQVSLLFARPQDVDPSVNGQFSTHIGFHRLQARYRRRTGPWDVLAQAALGYNGTDLTLGRGVSLSVAAIQADARLEVRRPLGSALRLLLGLDSQNGYVMLDAAVPAPVREGELMRPPGTLHRVRTSKRDFIGNVGLYAELTYQPLQRLILTPGLRFDYYGHLMRWTLDPRLSLRLRLFAPTWLKLGAGLYSQDPPVQDYFGDFGNPAARLERAAHLSLAVEQAIWRGLVLEVTGLYKHLWDGTAPSALSRRFGEEVRPERVANTGSGRIYGGTFLLRQHLSRHLFGWLSYSLLRSERRDCPACPLRLFDFDQTHVLILAVHVYLPWRFEIGARFRYISGLPYTLARGGVYDSDADLYQPRPSPERNAERLPATHQLDLRVDKTFAFKRWRLKLYIDVSNVYNNPAAEAAVYSYDYTQSAALTGLPIIPSFGIRGEI